MNSITGLTCVGLYAAAVGFAALTMQDAPKTPYKAVQSVQSSPERFSGERHQAYLLSLAASNTTYADESLYYLLSEQTAKARFVGGISCTSPEDVEAVLAKPSLGEVKVRSSDCRQMPTHDVVLYRGKLVGEATQVMFPATGTQMWVPTMALIVNKE